MANSRLADRASFFAEVDLLCAGESMPQRLWSQDLSEQGMFVQTSRPFAPGDRVSLRFDVDTNEVYVRAAEVVWVKRFEPINVDGRLPGVGLRFLSVDPPSRAAIRRYVNGIVDTLDSDVPAPPPEPELLPDGDYVSLVSLRPLSLPPFDSNPPMSESMPPPSFSEPPAPAQHANDYVSAPPQPAPRPVTVPPPPAVEAPAPDAPAMSARAQSAPPSEAEIDDVLLFESRESFPPDEAITEPDHPAEPAAIPSLEPMPTDDGEDHEHPLAGWSFRVERATVEANAQAAAEAAFEAAFESAEEEAPAISLPPDMFDPSEKTPVAAGPDADAPDNSEETRWSFESEPPRPASLTPSWADDDFPNDTLPPERIAYFLGEPSFDDEPPVVNARTPLSPALDVDNERIDDAPPGRVIQPKPDRPPVTAAEGEKLDAAFFDGKLSVMELPQSDVRGTSVTGARRNRGAWAAGLLVAGAVIGAVVGYQPPAEEAPAPAEHVVAEATEVSAQPRAVADAEAALFGAGEPAPTPSQVTSAKPAPAPAKPASEPAKVAPAPAEAAPVALTNAVAPQAKPKGGVVAEYGRVTLPLVGGKVARSFGLADPSRVVVDLVGAEFPGHKALEVNDKGITRVRFGRPDPEHVRVVIELSGTKQPAGITTLKRSKSLAAAWR
jgi:uncharacterized protein (TIGR02266 family)